MKRWKLVLPVVIMCLFSISASAVPEQEFSLPDGDSLYVQIQNGTMQVSFGLDATLGEPENFPEGGVLLGEGKELYIVSDADVTLGASCEYETVCLIGNGENVSFHFMGKASKLYQFECAVTVALGAQAGTLEQLQSNPLSAGANAKGDEPLLVCGIKGHDYEGKPLEHCAASCGIIQGVNTKTSTHFVCDGREHSPTLCAKCGKEGHQLGDGQSHGRRGCGKHYYCDSEKLNHGKAACFAQTGHYNCDGKDHHYMSACGHYACDPRHGSDCVQATQPPVPVPMCPRCNKPLADHAICPACGLRLCQDQVATHLD